MALTKVTNTGIADDAVTTDKIEDGTVVAADIAPGTIANAKLANSSITVNGSSVSLGGAATLKHIDWQSLTVADGSTTLNAEAGKGYFLDTNAGVIEVFLPSSPTRGDTVVLADYSGTFATNQIIINTGGELLDSTAGNDFKVTTNNSIVELIYVDSAKGWLVKLNQAAGTTPSSVLTNGLYDTDFSGIEATGGTITNVGGYRIHTFTGDGCFAVSTLGSGGTPTQNEKVDYLVVAGGGGGGAATGGGGGAGGFRVSNVFSLPAPTTSPLASSCGLTVTATTYPITVGAGGAGAPCTTPTPRSSSGSNSVFSTITSTGGGGSGGGNNCGSPLRPGLSGGSGGGAAWGDDAYNPPMINPPSGVAAGGSGNTPPTSPPQGNAGGASGIGCYAYGGGGGGAGAVGFSHPTALSGGNSSGGVGSYVSSCFAGCNGETGPVCGAKYFAGGGGGRPRSCVASVGGIGGGGDYGSSTPTGNAVANTGGGGGAIYPNPGGSGGKGIVIIRYKY